MLSTVFITSTVNKQEQYSFQETKDLLKIFNLKDDQMNLDHRPEIYFYLGVTKQYQWCIIVQP